jgi:hypothetical protein
MVGHLGVLDRGRAQKRAEAPSRDPGKTAREMATWQMRAPLTRYKVITAGPPFLSEREAFTSSFPPSLGRRARSVSSTTRGLEPLQRVCV